MTTKYYLLHLLNVFIKVSKKDLSSNYEDEMFVDNIMFHYNPKSDWNLILCCKNFYCNLRSIHQKISLLIYALNKYMFKCIFLHTISQRFIKVVNPLDTGL